MSDPFQSLLERIASKAATVRIVGPGGVDLGRAFAAAGLRVIGFEAVVVPNRPGPCDSPHPTAAGFELTADHDRLTEPDVIVLCVPPALTPTRTPDLAGVVTAADTIARRLRPGQLIVVGSAGYPGATRHVVLPRLAAGGRVVGKDFFLACSPEPDDAKADDVPLVGPPPRVVGGLSTESLDLAAALFGLVTPQVVRVSSPEVAEACKILENTYRAVNIALVNELKVLYDRMGIDVWEVIDAARTKPFGFQAFYPGPGLEGRGAAEPYYLSWISHRHGLTTRFVELAGEVNTSMPAYVVGKVADALNEAGRSIKGSKVLILGMASRRDAPDLWGSAGLELMDLLLKKGAVVGYNDPHIPTLPQTDWWPHPAKDSTPLAAECLAAQDCVLIGTAHSAYDYEFVVAHSRLVVDTRNATRDVKAGREKVIRA
jgi:UDP-N-acetyl-D-glucosamine dehydrogenase